MARVCTEILDMHVAATANTAEHQTSSVGVPAPVARMADGPRLGIEWERDEATPQDPGNRRHHAAR